MNTQSHQLRNIFLTIVISAAVFASGCASTPHTVYPDFKKQRGNLGNLLIVMDLVYIHDVDGDKDALALNEMMELAPGVSRKVKEQLETQGHTVLDTIFVGSGYGANADNITEILVKDVYSDDETGVITKAPFYVAESVSSYEDNELKQLHAIYNKIGALHLQEDKSETPVTFEIPPSLLSNPQIDHIVFMQVVGKNVGFGKSFGQGMLTGLFLGIGVMEVSFIQGTYGILNIKTGKAIWSDNKYQQGGGVNIITFEKFAANMFYNMN